MFPGTIRGHNFTYTAPPGVDNCQDLRVRREVFQIKNPEGKTVDSFLTVSSAWFPTPDELAALNAGEPVVLTIYADRHPVVSMSVQSPEPINAG